MKNKRAALTAGYSLILMTVAAGIAYGYFHGKLLAALAEEPALLNISATAGLLKGELMLWIPVLLCDVAAALGLYFYLKPAGRAISMAAAALRLVYVLIFGIAIYHLFRILPLQNIPAEADRIRAELDLFEKIWSRGLIIFGLHLLGLSWLMFKADYIPVILAILIFIAALSYVGINLAYGLAPGKKELISQIESILTLPMTVEPILGLWLLIRGGRSR